MFVFGRRVIRQMAIFEKNKTMTAIDGLRQSNLSQPQEDSLYLIAGDATTQAPLAKALLTVLQDTIFPIELPDEPVQGRSSGNALPEQVNARVPTITLRPNPATEQTTILLPQSAEYATLRVYSSTGHLLKTAEFSGNQTLLYTRGLPPGVYIVEVFDGKQRYQTKLAVKR